jgi:hypothetical protein
MKRRLGPGFFQAPRGEGVPSVPRVWQAQITFSKWFVSIPPKKIKDKHMGHIGTGVGRPPVGSQKKRGWLGQWKELKPLFDIHRSKNLLVEAPDAASECEEVFSRHHCKPLPHMNQATRSSFYHYCQLYKKLHPSLKSSQLG